jgi:hypothetical protein
MSVISKNDLSIYLVFGFFAQSCVFLVHVIFGPGMHATCMHTDDRYLMVCIFAPPHRLFVNKEVFAGKGNVSVVVV